MRQLLDIIEREMEAYGHRGIPDFDLLRMIAEYTLNYPDLVHHPKEDLIYRRLASRDASLQSTVGELIEEHKKLSELTQRLAAAVPTEN